MNRKTYAPELDTLDQLLGGNMPLRIIRKVYPDSASFVRGVYGALKCGDVRLLENNAEVPEWRQQELFERGGVLDNLDTLILELTDQGAKRVT
jgi:hypothetical protein